MENALSNPSQYLKQFCIFVCRNEAGQISLYKTKALKRISSVLYTSVLLDERE